MSLPRRVLVSGASGLLGTALVEALEGAAIQVDRLVRRPRSTGDGEILWRPSEAWIDRDRLESVDAVVHLAGESIARGRWSADKRARILESRVDGTGVLARAFASLNVRPRVFVSASAVGYYGTTGASPADEATPPGTGFLAEVCSAWENAAAPLANTGVRVVFMRFGVVLSGGGGMLRELLPIFRCGLGGTLGSGRQSFPWVSLEDAVRALCFVLERPEIAGPVNVVAPESINNAAWTKALGNALNRPTVFRVPSFAMRLALGQFAEEAILAGRPVRPRVLEEAGFSWRHRTLASFLASEFGSSA